MALGVEPNNLAPALIQSSGQALVQGIRQIGQQVSSHLTELQTKRDLGALAQEMQGLNVQSNEFPVQLTQLLSRHPLAARDERGQMALSILGKAHGQWQAGEAEARAFNRAMAMQGARDRAARDLYDYKREKELQDPQNVGGALVIPKDPATGQPNVLLPAPSRAGSNRPSVLAPGAVLVDPTGKKLAENPKAATASTSEARMQKKLKIDLLMRQDTAAREEFGRLERRRDALSQERMKISKADDPNAAYLDNTVKAIEEQAAALKKRREEIQKAIESIESVAAEEMELGAEEAGEGDLGLPPLSANAAAPADLPVLTPAQAAKLPSGTQFKGTNGRIYTAP